MPNEIMMPNVVGGFLQGREAAQSNQLRQMQIQQAQQAQQRDTQFRNELSTYLQGGSDNLAALYAADPERAMQVQQFQGQQNQLARAREVEQAKQAYAQAQGVLNSKAPSAYLRMLIPNVASQWSQHTGKSAEEMTDEEALALADQVSTMAGAKAGILPQQGEPFTLSEGQTRFDKAGRPVASVKKPLESEDPNKRQQTIFERANTLRDEFTAQTKDFSTISAQYGNIVATAAQPSAAGDIALITSYMRMLDPMSTVREGEFANAENASGVPGRVRAQYNKLLTGERMAPNQRNDFLNQAKNVYETRRKQADLARSKYTKFATRAGVDPLDVVGDGTGDESAAPPATAIAPKVGTVDSGYVFLGGDPADPKSWKKK